MRVRALLCGLVWLLGCEDARHVGVAGEADLWVEDAGELGAPDLPAVDAEEVGGDEPDAVVEVGGPWVEGEEPGEGPVLVDEAAPCGLVARDCGEGTTLRGAGEAGCYCAAAEAECAPGEVTPLGSAWPGYGGALEGRRRAEAPGAVETRRLRLLWSAPGAYVTGTPAVAGGVVFYGDWEGWLTARGARTGCLLWGRRISEAPLTASAQVAGGLVFVGDGAGVLYAVEAGSGRVRWASRVEEHAAAFLYGSPVVVGGLALIGVASVELTWPVEEFSFRGSLVAVEVDSGRERWRLWMTGDDEEGGAGVSVWSTPAVDEEAGLAFVGTGNAYEAPAGPLSDGLVAVEVETGRLVWKRQFTQGDVYSVFGEPPLGPDADVGAAPNLFMAGERAVVGVGDKAGVYSALDRRTGEVVWARALTPGSHLGGVMGPATVGEGLVFVASNRWPAGADTTQPFFPDFGDLSNTSEVFALEAETGAVRWRRALPRPGFGGLASAPGVVFVGTFEGTLRGIGSQGGEDLWVARPGATLASGVSLAGGQVFVGHGFSFFGLEAGPEGSRGGVVAFGP